MAKIISLKHRTRIVGELLVIVFTIICKSYIILKKNRLDWKYPISKISYKL